MPVKITLGREVTQGLGQEKTGKSHDGSRRKV